MSNRATEIIVGFVTLVALAVLIGVTVNLKKSTVFLRPYPLYAFFKDVKRLSEGAPVYVNGVVCGNVQKIESTSDREFPVRVTLMVKKGVALHRGAEPRIVGAGLMGEAEVNIEDTSPTGPVLQPEETIYGTPMSDLQDAIAAVSEILRDKRNRGAFTNLLESASSITMKIDRSLGTNPDDIAKTIHNIETATAKLSGLIGDLRTSAGPLLAQLSSTVGRVDKAIGEAEQAFALASKILSENRQDVRRAIEHLTSSSVRVKQFLTRGDQEGPLAEVIFGAQPYADFSRSLAEFKQAIEILRRGLEGLDRWLTGARRGQPPVEIPYEGVTTGTARTIK